MKERSWIAQKCLLCSTPVYSFSQSLSTNCHLYHLMIQQEALPPCEPLIFGFPSSTDISQVNAHCS